jgi:hypothetical protein
VVCLVIHERHFDLPIVRDRFGDFGTRL